MRKADALRTYETLSLNALPSIPVGSRLIGILGNVKDSIAEPPRSYRRKLAVKIVDIIGLQRVRTLSKHAMNATTLLPSYTSVVWGAMKFIIQSGNDVELSPSRKLEYVELTAGNLGFRELDQQGRILRAQKKAFTERIIMAMFGGLALIGPMLIMVLHPSRNTSVITVSAATFLFAFALAVFAKDSAGKDVLAATAAYAAVLVVFVGTSSSGS